MPSPGYDQCEWDKPWIEYILACDQRIAAVDFQNVFAPEQTFRFGFILPTGAQANYCMISDANGNVAWSSCPTPGGGGDGDVAGPLADTVAANEIVVYDGTNGKAIGARNLNALCQGPKDPFECCTTNQAGTCQASIDTGTVSSVSLDATGATAAQCLTLREGRTNGTNTMKWCAPSNLSRDVELTLRASGNISASDVQNPTGTSGVCARFDGSALLDAHSVDCLKPSEIETAFNPRTRTRLFEDLMTVYADSGAGEQTGNIGYGWWKVDDNRVPGNCATGLAINSPTPNHPGQPRVETTATTSAACWLRNATPGFDMFPPNLFSRTTWSMEWAGARQNTTTNTIWAMGLFPGNINTLTTEFPNYFVGLVLRNTNDTELTDLSYCKARGVPFACCTGNLSGNCTDLTYKCVACDADPIAGSCQEEDTDVTPSPTNTFDRFQLRMKQNGILECGVASSDSEEDYDRITVSQHIPSNVATTFGFGIGTSDAVIKTVIFDFFYYVDNGLAR